MHNQKGFTLIEVMIAAVILFAAIAVTSELYKNSILVAEKTSDTVEFYQTHPAAISAIKSDLLEQYKRAKSAELSGTILVMGISYQWQANRVSFDARAPDLVDGQQGSRRFSYYNVEVNAVKEKKTQQFTFEASAW